MCSSQYFWCEFVMQTRMVFGRHKSGHIFPMKLWVEQISGNNAAVSFMGVCQAVSTKDNFIFVDSTGLCSYFTAG